MTDNIKDINTTALAYIGDAVYEIYVRKHCIMTGQCHADALHKKAVAFVKAEGQAFALKRMMEEDFFTSEEISLIKRARNHKIASKPKNVAPLTYKHATAFEAILGLMHLQNQEERLAQIVERAIEIIELEGKNR